MTIQKDKTNELQPVESISIVVNSPQMKFLGLTTKLEKKSNRIVIENLKSSEKCHVKKRYQACKQKLTKSNDDFRVHTLILPVSL
jgi:hypothetical protein